MNLYAYCGSNPVNWVDPWGLYTNEELKSEIETANEVMNSLYEGYLGEGVPPKQVGLEEAGNPYQGSSNPMKNEFEQMSLETAKSYYDLATSLFANLLDPDGNFWNYWYQAEIQRQERYIEWLKEQLEEQEKGCQ